MLFGYSWTWLLYLQFYKHGHQMSILDLPSERHVKEEESIVAVVGNFYLKLLYEQHLKRIEKRGSSHEKCHSNETVICTIYTGIIVLSLWSVPCNKYNMFIPGA